MSPSVGAGASAVGAAAGAGLPFSAVLGRFFAAPRAIEREIRHGDLARSWTFVVLCVGGEIEEPTEAPYVAGTAARTDARALGNENVSHVHV